MRDQFSIFIFVQFFMTIQQITNYIQSQTEPKRTDMQTLHQLILQQMPACKAWFLDGRNAEGKTVSNPNIGYGTYIIKYADGKSKEFYQIGLSANTTGISVYIMGIKDKNYLKNAYRNSIGKASVTGYCIKFRNLKDIHLEILESAIRFGLEASK